MQGSPIDPAAYAQVRRHLALEPRGDLFGARVLETRRDRRRGPTAKRGDQSSFFARLPEAIAVQIGPGVSPLPNRRVRIGRRAQFRTWIPPVPAVVAF